MKKPAFIHRLDLIATKARRAFDRERNYPQPNLFVSALQRLGIEEDKFATSTGTMRGLEMI